MIYIYDKVMNERRVLSLNRYGATYKLEKKFRMGDRDLYSFVCPGMEKILVVPQFAEQYRELEKALAAATGLRTYENCCQWIRKNVNRDFEEEEFPTDEAENGVMQVITTEYKDINVRFEYLNDALRLGADFEIRDNNLFGNGIFVTMRYDLEES